MSVTAAHCRHCQRIIVHAPQLPGVGPHNPPVWWHARGGALHCPAGALDPTRQPLRDGWPTAEPAPVAGDDQVVAHVEVRHGVVWVDLGLPCLVDPCGFDGPHQHGLASQLDRAASVRTPDQAGEIPP